MPSVNDLVDPRTIVRVRLVVGALLLFAAVLTWFIGLTLSPHGKAVVAGTEHVRSTVVTFKHNGAIGTLILSAVSSWLLFPGWRSNRPVRNWTLVVLISLLVASSAYTLLSLGPSIAPSATFDDNLATSYINDENSSALVPDAPLPNMGAPLPGATGATVGQPNKRGTSTDQAESAGGDLSGEQAKGSSEGGPQDEDEIANDVPDENRD